MRVIGYNDPRKLNEIDDWKELREYDHFCISQTLVQGLSREFGRTEFKVLTTIDKLIKKFYREWYDNPEKDVKHFLDIRRYIEEIQNPKLKKSFMENKTDVYNSIRFLIECEISSNELENDRLTDEKIEFLKIYKKIEQSTDWAEFKELDYKTIYSLKEAIKEIVIDEVEREIDKKSREGIKGIEFSNLINEDKKLYLNDIIRKLDIKIKKSSEEKGKRQKRLKERLEMYKEILVNYENKEINKVIFHGIHQFTPIVLKLIRYLEKNNIEVIFLINYNENFTRIYSTWDKVYRWTGCTIEKNITKYKYDQLQIAKNYAAIVEGKFDELTEESNIVIDKFDNYTEMGHYIADKYEKAKDSIDGKFDPAKVLANMEEQFYSVDGTNINNILQVYFPEQFEQKHFLSYPVGQLILAIYNLWDENKNEIRMKESAIRECLSTNIWTNRNKESLYTPIEIFEMIKVYFSDLEENKVDIYIQRIQELKGKIRKINNIKDESRKNDYKRLGFYRVTINEVEYFERIILELKKIIETLMGDGKDVNMMQHYKNLLSLIGEKINSNNDESLKKEINFVREIDKRISKLDSTSNESIAAIKETLHFYLAQNKSEDSSSWIVRDFNQIDGGVLLADPNAKEKSIKEKRSTYHFMEISDRDMQGKSKIKLSWPLDESFIGNSTEVLSIVNTCKTEYKNYLRFTLFYALFYIGEIDIKISYIENKDENLKEELYYVLKMLNLNENPGVILDDLNFEKTENVLEDNTIIKHELVSPLDIINYNFCEDRFVYESLIDGDGCYNNSFLIKQYLKNLIAISIYKTKNEKDLSKRILEVIPYANSTMINDIEFDSKEKVKYFINYGKLDLHYENIVKNYIFAKFKKDNIIDSLVQYNRNPITINEVISYLKGGAYKGKKQIEYKCVYCKYRQICTGQI